MAYEVRTAVYEGPFDLLLSLILREEVEVWQVSLGDIVAAYLVEVERLAALDLEVATEFLVIAATLVELKARRLMPGPAPDDAEDLELLSERDLLVARLAECKTFRDAGAALCRAMTAAEASRARRVGPEEHFLELRPSLGSMVSPDDLRTAYTRVMGARPVVRVDLYHVAPIRTTVAEVAESVAREVQEAGRTTFRRLTAGLDDRIEVVLCFLAVLELFKEGRVELHQSATFGELAVWHRDPSLGQEEEEGEAAQADAGLVWVGA